MGDQRKIEVARVRASDTAPILWMLGHAGAGQSSLVAHLVHGWRAALRPEFEPATPTAEQFAHPEELPLIRFLLTTGLRPGEPYDPSEDMAFMEASPGLILVTVAAAELDHGGLRAALRTIRDAHPDWRVLVAQTRLHELYPEGAGHPTPYPFTPAIPVNPVPPVLAAALAAQRGAFDGLADGFVPLDLTEGEALREPHDYGMPQLLAAMQALAPELVPGLAPGPDPEEGIRQQVIIPWAMAAAAADAPPLPLLGGVPAMAFQAAMVRAIARRYGLGSDAAIWAALIAGLGAGFLLRHAMSWMVRQMLKLAPFWGSAAVSAWTFAVTCGLGEAAIRICRDEAEDRRPTPAALRAAFRNGQRHGDALHDAGRGGAPY